MFSIQIITHTVLDNATIDGLNIIFKNCKAFPIISAFITITWLMKRKKDELLKWIHMKIKCTGQELQMNEDKRISSY